jgi:acyl-CoA synthetase (AMP-forming)/AMP-acid ligase II
MLRREVLTQDDSTVGILLPPSVAAVVVNVAMAIDRRVTANLNYTVTSPVLNECIAQAKIRTVLTSAKFLEKVSFDLDARVIPLEELKDKVGTLDKLVAVVQAVCIPACLLDRLLGLNHIRPDDLLTLIFTSGSTGKPKGVMLSHANISPNVEVAYVATGANFADALAAGGAARGRGPVLLVRSDGIPDATATELARLRPRRIVVLGGTAVVAASVQTSLAAYTTGSVSRVGGADRYATAASLSQSTFAPGVPVVYVATGVNFADALSAAALGAPVLLARPTCLPASTKAELDRLGAERVVVLGGTAALSDDVRRLTGCS